MGMAAQLPSGCFLSKKFLHITSVDMCGYYQCRLCVVHPLCSAEYKHGIVVLSSLVLCGIIYDIHDTILEMQRNMM